MLQAVAQHPGDVRRRTLQVVQPGAVAGDLLEQAELRIQPLGLVVQQQAGVGFALARPAGNHHQRRLLGVGRCDGVDHVQRPGAVGHRRHTQGPAAAAVAAIAAVVADACGRIRRKTHARLVRQRVQRQDARGFDDLEVGQRKVARDAEDLAGPVGLQCVQQGFGEVHGGRCRRGGGGWRSNPHCRANRAQTVFVWRLRMRP
jgi:hypothetical protein